MADFRKQQTVNASISEVWNILDDFGSIADWHPGLRQSALLENSPHTGSGARRRCDFADGKHYILEEIVGYEDGRMMQVQIYGGNIPVKTSKITFRVQPLSPDQTRISAEVAFKLKGGLLGEMFKPLAKIQLGKDISKLLSANKHHAERAAI